MASVERRFHFVLDVLVPVVVLVIAGLILEVVKTPFTKWADGIWPEFGQTVTRTPFWMRLAAFGAVALGILFSIVRRRKVSATVAPAAPSSATRRLLAGIPATMPRVGETDGGLGARILILLREWQLRAGSQPLEFSTIAEKTGIASDPQRVEQVTYRLLNDDLVFVAPGTTVARISPRGQQVLKDPALWATQVDGELLEAILEWKTR